MNDTQGFKLFSNGTGCETLKNKEMSQRDSLACNLIMNCKVGGLLYIVSIEGRGIKMAAAGLRGKSINGSQIFNNT